MCRMETSDTDDTNESSARIASNRWSRRQWVVLLTMALASLATKACSSVLLPFFPQEVYF